jgi:hypothetical protein
MKVKNKNYDIEKAKKELEKYRKTNKYNVANEDLDYTTLKKNNSN